FVMPVMSMFAPGRGEAMPPTSKKRKPDCVPCGSTALAANCDESISSISFLLMPPFTLCGRGIGLGRVLDCGLERRRYRSSIVMGVSFERFAVISLIPMLAMEIGWSPSLVITKKI